MWVEISVQSIGLNPCVFRLFSMILGSSLMKPLSTTVSISSELSVNVWNCIPCSRHTSLKFTKSSISWNMKFSFWGTYFT